MLNKTVIKIDRIVNRMSSSIVITELHSDLTSFYALQAIDTENHTMKLTIRNSKYYYESHAQEQIEITEDEFILSQTMLIESVQHAI